MNISLWLTDPASQVLLQKQTVLPIPATFPLEFPTIHVDDSIAFQIVEGFGFTLTGGSALLINQLEPVVKRSLLRELFARDGSGIGISYLRLTIGASDLSERSFSYNDIPESATDFELAGFDLMAGDNHVIPLLQEILSINRDIAILATPWSAPAWMKTQYSYIAGNLRPDCYAVYAQYLLKYLQQMQNLGITIKAITVQNEPANGKNEPSMIMTAAEQATFIREYLGPALRDAACDTAIFCWDHNCDLVEYPLSILDDPATNPFVAGVAWHLYAGDIEALSHVHHRHPDKKMYFTEQWVGADGHFAGDLKWHMRHVMVGSLRNWSQVVLEWNLAGDSNHGPHTMGGESQCVGALTISTEIQRNVAYFVVGHAAKFIPPGSRRIASNEVEPLCNVAFRTPAGNTVLLVENDAEQEQVFEIDFQGEKTVTMLAGGAVGTYVW